MLMLFCGLSLAEDLTQIKETPQDASPSVSESVYHNQNSAISDTDKAKDSAQTSSSDYTSPRISTGQDWAMVIFTFLGIILFILALGWAAKRFGGLSAMGVRDMKVVAALPLGSREKVAIIDVKGQQILIGITPQNINHIHTFDQPVVNVSDKVQSDFAQKLSHILKSKSVVNDEQN